MTERATKRRGWRHTTCPSGVAYWIPGERDDEWDGLCDDVPFVLPNWALSQVDVDDLQSQLAAAIKRAEGAEAENAKLKQWPVPVWVWGNDEYPFGMEWQLDGDTFIISIECGHVESTWFKGGKVHEIRTWTDPVVAALEKERDELREVVVGLVSDIDLYLDWAKRNGKTNSEIVRIGKEARQALAESEGGA